MKKLVLFSLLVFGSLMFNKASAQGNLQFNQVVFYDLTFGTPQAFTVPAGKVWKVESVGVASNTCSLWLMNSSSLYIGILHNGSTNIPTLPLWFPSSYSGFFSYSVGSCSGQHAFVSIIEFNVVP